MKIVVIGGTGLIGSKTIERLRGKGHDVVAASPSTGVNILTGEGVTEAVAGANVVVDLANSPSFEEKAALEFFRTAGRNLLAAEAAAGVKHHVALSVVGTERLQNIGYFRGKQVQEDLIKNSAIPYTIVHSTQFYEFMGAIAQSGASGQTVRLPPALFQPIAADDVAGIMADVAIATPANRMIEIAGPDRVRMSDAVTRFLEAANDPRTPIADPHALYFGVELDDSTLVPGDNPRLGRTHYDDWLKRSARKN